MEYSLDGHKLAFHPKRVADWLDGVAISPIYVEISLVNQCNHRCSFCAFDYTAYTGDFLEKRSIADAIRQLSELGVKSMVFAGTGEPLLHKDIVYLIKEARNSGIDVSLSTNGSLLSKEMSEDILPALSWVRFSFNAGSEKTYSRIHGCSQSEFGKVLAHIEQCVKLKKEKNLNVTIGIQSLLLQENIDDLHSLALHLKGVGVDYFTVKPFSPHPYSKNRRKVHPVRNVDEQWRETMESLSTETFQVIIRQKAMRALQEKRGYQKCLGLPFILYIEADGSVYGCNSFVGDKNCVFGNIKTTTITEILQGGQRQEIMERLSSMNDTPCRRACRLDQINRYLWALKNPGPHVNFI